MKNSMQILSSLQDEPQFKKLSRFACIDRIKALFPPRLQRFIRHGYFKADILYFVLNHPGAKQEFDNIIDSIKAPLRAYTPKECEASPVTDIRAYVSYKKEVHSEEEKRITVVDFEERSQGNFINNTQVEKLHLIIEKIRQTIKNKDRS